MDATRPLHGLRVIDGSSFVAGPSGAMTLAQLGADVIRFDPRGGASDYRRLPLSPDGDSLYWASLNKGKRSIALDLRSPDGREVVQRLITAPGPEGGILLTNHVGREWLSYEALSKRRPDLIMVHVQGHADGTPAVDYTINSTIGFPSITGTGGALPSNHALPAWDLLTGAHAALGVLAAERRRARTGEGSLVTVALEDVALWATDSLGYLLESALLGPRQPAGNFVYGTFGSDFLTRDNRRVMVVALTRRMWRDLIALTGTAAVVSALEDALAVDFEDDGARWRHREAIAALMKPWFAEHDAATIKKRMTSSRVLFSVYRTFDELLEDRETVSNPIFDTVSHGALGEALATASPLANDGRRLPAVGAPSLGADTHEVLAEVLAMPPHDIARLVNQAVIA